jgi:hypothetical protein
MPIPTHVKKKTCLAVWSGCSVSAMFRRLTGDATCAALDPGPGYCNPSSLDRAHDSYSYAPANGALLKLLGAYTHNDVSIYIYSCSGRD